MAKQNMAQTAPAPVLEAGLLAEVLKPLRGLQSPLVRAAFLLGKQVFNPGVRDDLFLNTILGTQQGIPQSQLPYALKLELNQAKRQHGRFRKVPPNKAA